MPRIELNLTHEQVRALDAARGKVPRATYIKDMLDEDKGLQNFRRWLAKTTSSVTEPPTRRGPRIST
jgi:hypothetical protein